MSPLGSRGDRALLHALDHLAVALVGVGEQQHPAAVLARADDEGVDLAAGDGAAHVLGFLQALLERGNLGVEAGGVGGRFMAASFPAGARAQLQADQRALGIG